MIKTFADKRTAALFSGRFVKALPTDVAVRAKRKLDLIDSAASLDFLKVPPGNRLEAMRGDRAGQYSIRVNDQWRSASVGLTVTPSLWSSAIITIRNDV